MKKKIETIDLTNSQNEFLKTFLKNKIQEIQYNEALENEDLAILCENGFVEQITDEEYCLTIMGQKYLKTKNKL